MDWILQTLYWYIHLLVIGIIFFPLTKKLFPKFYDFGYSFSKTIGVIAITYTALFLGTLKILAFSQTSLYILLVLFGCLSLYIFIKGKQKNNTSLSIGRIIFIVFQEVIFLVSLFFLAYVRGQEPSIHGLEKFMDFGFMQSILKSTHFPPLDMWYSAGPDVNGVSHPEGYPINYYYFGHMTGAMIIKLSGISAFVGYNLILATILAQGASMTFSLVSNIIFLAQKTLNKEILFPNIKTYFLGLLGSFILNFGGNFHTIYLFTTGYPNEKPLPFWEVWSKFNPANYWYPNATRFIPFTIHEFPSYSYVVADLHGHVFAIPFVLLTISILFHLFYSSVKPAIDNKQRSTKKSDNNQTNILKAYTKEAASYSGIVTMILGFMIAVHYMTNIFDTPVYLLLTLIVLFYIHRLTYRFLIHFTLLIISFVFFSLPFSSHFAVFGSGIGVNCSPAFMFDESTSNTFKVGPFLFEKGNCQHSPFWMLFTLWGFFWLSFVVLIGIKLQENKFIKDSIHSVVKGFSKVQTKLKASSDIYSDLNKIDLFMMLLFLVGTFLVIVPEFFYAKDIYPAHFRANTMFKLGYQAFIMMSIASIYTIFRIKALVPSCATWIKFLIAFTLIPYFFIFNSSETKFPMEQLLILPLIFLIIISVINLHSLKTIFGFISIYIITNALCFICIYPFFSFPSYYGNLRKTAAERKTENITTNLDGIAWLKETYLEDYEIIQYINTSIKGQPVILEAQGDSYTDYERISTYTGAPTISGWWVHEWLWRGSSEVVGNRIPDITSIYESNDITLTKTLLKKYSVKYVVISSLERQKYPQLNEEKFKKIGKRIFESSNKFGALYQVN